MEIQKKSLLRRLFMLITLAVTTIAANAQDTVDLGALELGVEYQAPGKCVSTATFTAPASGTLWMSFETKYTVGCIYEDASYTKEVPGLFNNNYGDPAVSYEVTEGTEYYLSINNIISESPYIFAFYMNGLVSMPFKVTYITPSPGEESTFQLSVYETVSVTFNMEVESIRGGSLKYMANDKTEKTIALDTYKSPNFNTIVEATLSPVLTRLLQDEGPDGIQPGNPLTVIFHDVKNRYGNLCEEADENGDVKVSYLCGTLVTRLENAKWPSRFLSYWPEGDPDGIVVLEYSEELQADPAPTVSLIMGNIEQFDGFYRSDFPATVEGNLVYADLTGVRRTIEDIMENPTFTDYMTVMIKGIYDINGAPVASTVTGSIGAAEKTIPYYEIPRSIVASEWTPSSGSLLDGQNRLEVWIIGLKAISFDGFSVEYTYHNEQKTYQVTTDEITISDLEDEGNEAVYSFTLPEEIVKAADITITPYNLVALDGYDYTEALIAVFNLGYDGVESIFKDTNLTVYTLSGLRLDSVTSKEDLTKLPKGIYIVDGKKIKL